MFKFVPIILVVLALTGGLFFFQRREALKKQMDELLQKSKLSMSTALPEPTPSVGYKGTNGDIPVFTPMPTTSEAKTTAKKTVAEVTTHTESDLPAGRQVCTPVYGMANSCAEHVVVDTGLDSGIFMNLAGVSYVGGLVAFVKAKRRS